MVIKKKYIKTFFWSNDNWKTFLRKYYWNDAMSFSPYWNEPSLVGDLDASRAMLITYYWINDLGLDNIVEWINKNKNKWELDPPLWYTDHWKNNLRRIIKEKCYKNEF